MARHWTSIIVSVLSLAFLTRAWAGAAPSPGPSGSPLPPLDPQARHALFEKCREAIRAWATAQAHAHAELAACSLHLFDEDCRRLAQLRGKLVAEGSPCMQIPETLEKIHQLPELNCNIVKVPDTCLTR